MLEQETRDDAENFHRVMSLLRNMTLEHAKCHPREDRACTHCNAEEELRAMQENYKGPRIVASQSPYS